MAEAAEPGEEGPKRGGRKPLLIGLGLALLLGGGGFYGVYSGLIPIGGATEVAADSDGLAPLPDVSFLPVPPLVISLPGSSRHAHLRFAAELEVPKAHAAEVQGVMPRVLDVLNSYLRAVDPAEFEDPGTLLRLRAQMLRRVQIVVGEGRVRDLLVTEFVMN